MMLYYVAGDHARRTENWALKVGQITRIKKSDWALGNVFNRALSEIAAFFVITLISIHSVWTDGLFQSRAERWVSLWIFIDKISFLTPIFHSFFNLFSTFHKKKSCRFILAVSLPSPLPVLPWSNVESRCIIIILCSRDFTITCKNVLA